MIEYYNSIKKKRNQCTAAKATKSREANPMRSLSQLSYSPLAALLCKKSKTNNTKSAVPRHFWFV